MLTVTTPQPRAILRRAAAVVLFVVAGAIAASATTQAVWMAQAPGKGLEPVGPAAEMVTVTQAPGRIDWQSHAGQVETVQTVGWGVAGDDVELAGAVVLQAVDAAAGTIETSEAPASITFTFGD
ncbi:MAG: hypothetical protein DIU67_002705 [Actinomycetes bacterium]|jgi:hypothetical protein|nr:MAG: hypothetical protein DIU67_03965 [Actinomycetota bacterium]